MKGLPGMEMEGRLEGDAKSAAFMAGPTLCTLELSPLLPPLPSVLLLCFSGDTPTSLSYGGGARPLGGKG